MRPRFVLFGDSVTEFSFDPENAGWGAAIAHRYARKVDVVLRGFSGYNTRWARFLLPKIFPPVSQECPPLLVTIFFGANDAVLHNHTFNQKHVPLQEYKDNLIKIISHIKNCSETTKIVLITPPPVDKRGLQQLACSKYGANPDDPPSRSNEVTGTYAQACNEVGKECNVPVLDLWSSLQQHIHWPKLLSDGLHLSADGNRIVFEKLMVVLNGIGLSTDSIELDFPQHDQVDLEHPAKSFF